MYKNVCNYVQRGQERERVYIYYSFFLNVIKYYILKSTTNNKIKVNMDGVFSFLFLWLLSTVLQFDRSIFIFESSIQNISNCFYWSLILVLLNYFKNSNDYIDINFFFFLKRLHRHNPIFNNLGTDFFFFFNNTGSKNQVVVSFTTF